MEKNYLEINESNDYGFADYENNKSYFRNETNYENNNNSFHKEINVDNSNLPTHKKSSVTTYSKIILVVSSTVVTGAVVISGSKSENLPSLKETPTCLLKEDDETGLNYYSLKANIDNSENYWIFFELQEYDKDFSTLSDDTSTESYQVIFKSYNSDEEININEKINDIYPQSYYRYEIYYYENLKLPTTFDENNISSVNDESLDQNGQNKEDKKLLYSYSWKCDIQVPSIKENLTYELTTVDSTKCYQIKSQILNPTNQTIFIQVNYDNFRECIYDSEEFTTGELVNFDVNVIYYDTDLTYEAIVYYYENVPKTIDTVSLIENEELASQYNKVIVDSLTWTNSYIAPTKEEYEVEYNYNESNEPIIDLKSIINNPDYFNIYYEVYQNDNLVYENMSYEEQITLIPRIKVNHNDNITYKVYYIENLRNGTRLDDSIEYTKHYLINESFVYQLTQDKLQFFNISYVNKYTDDEGNEYDNSFVPLIVLENPNENEIQIDINGVIQSNNEEFISNTYQSQVVVLSSTYISNVNVYEYISFKITNKTTNEVIYEQNLYSPTIIERINSEYDTGDKVIDVTLTLGNISNENDEQIYVIIYPQNQSDNQTIIYLNEGDRTDSNSFIGSKDEGQQLITEYNYDEPGEYVFEYHSKTNAHDYLIYSTICSTN